MASLIDKTDKIKRYKYKVHSVELLVKGEKPLKLETRRVRSFSIENRFEEYVYPLFKITMVMSNKLYYYVLHNKTNCKLHLRIRMYYETVDTKKKSVYKDYINDNFNIIEDASQEDMEHALKQEISKKDYKKLIKDDANEMKKTDQNRVSFFLFKAIDGGRRQVGAVLKNANITDAISYICTVAGRDNIIMTPPDNKTKYRQLLIPHTTVIKALSFIDTYYGIYKKGSMIWFDFNKTYIIPYSGDCKAWLKKEVKSVTIIIPKSINTNKNNTNGMLVKSKDKANYYVVTSSAYMNIKNESISTNYIKGNDVTIVDSYSGKVTEGKSKAKTQKAAHATVKINHTENNYLASMYTSQSNAKSVVITLRMFNINAAVFTPNKKYNLVFEDKKYSKKYNGKYIVSMITHKFNDGDTVLDNESIIILKKDIS